jgi:type IV pilus assembly protein PilW
MPRTTRSMTIRSGQRGFSLVELSIAVLIALFLLGGLVTLVMGTRRTNGTQTAVSQLQDNQRIAMTLLANVVQKAGYFADPVNQQLSSFSAENPLAGYTLPAGQVVGGTYNGLAPGDTLLVRFFAPTTDPYKSIIDCAGQSNTASVANTWYTNAFQIGLVGTTNWLQCQTRTSNAGAVLTINLVPNVTNLSVLYGVSSAAAGDDFSLVQWLNAGQMSATNWANVTVVKVTLTFQLPAYGTTGGQMTNCATTLPCTSTFSRVIPIMSRTGVDT